MEVIDMKTVIDILRTRQMNESDIGFREGLQYAMSLLRQQQKVGAEIIKHGKWIIGTSAWGCDLMKCSNCIKSIDKQNFLYCPYCGARMDAKE